MIGSRSGPYTFLTFLLGSEVYALDVLQVREVVDLTDVTRIPRAPSFMKGILNLRGSVIPIVDLRRRFGLDEAERTADTCVIVLEVDIEGEVTVLGAVADAVLEVFEAGGEDLEPPPRIGTPLDPGFIRGIGKRGDRFFIVLDTERVFMAQEMSWAQEAKLGEDQDTPAARRPAAEALAEPHRVSAEMEP